MAIRKGHIPKPFQRPSANLDHHGRRWMDLPAELVRVGDIVPGLGLVRHRPVRHGSQVMISALGGTASFPADLELRVFARAH